MNHTIKDETVKKFRYDTYEQLEDDFLRFQDHHNLETRLKSIGELTPYEKVLQFSGDHPEKFTRELTKEILRVCTPML